MEVNRGKYSDGVKACGAKPGDTVRCVGARDEQGFPRFTPGQSYEVVSGPDDAPRVRSRMKTGQDGGRPSPFLFEGFGFFFEVQNPA